jgi:hypothetical protein
MLIYYVEIIYGVNRMELTIRYQGSNFHHPLCSYLRSFYECILFMNSFIVIETLPFRRYLARTVGMALSNEQRFMLNFVRIDHRLENYGRLYIAGPYGL